MPSAAPRVKQSAGRPVDAHATPRASRASRSRIRARRRRCCHRCRGRPAAARSWLCRRSLQRASASAARACAGRGGTWWWRPSNVVRPLLLAQRRKNRLLESEYAAHATLVLVRHSSQEDVQLLCHVPRVVHTTQECSRLCAHLGQRRRSWHRCGGWQCRCGRRRGRRCSRWRGRRCSRWVGRRLGCWPWSGGSRTVKRRRWL